MTQRAREVCELTLQIASMHCYCTHLDGHLCILLCARQGVGHQPQLVPRPQHCAEDTLALAGKHLVAVVQQLTNLFGGGGDVCVCGESGREGRGWGVSVTAAACIKRRQSARCVCVCLKRRHGLQVVLWLCTYTAHCTSNASAAPTAAVLCLHHNFADKKMHVAVACQ